MTKAKFMRLKQIISRISDPTLKRLDRLQEAARQPGVNLQGFLKVCRDIGSPLEACVPADQVNKTGEELMQACQLSKIDPREFQSITARIRKCHLI